MITSFFPVEISRFLNVKFSCKTNCCRFLLVGQILSRKSFTPKQLLPQSGSFHQIVYRCYELTQKKRKKIKNEINHESVLTSWQWAGWGKYVM